MRWLNCRSNSVSQFGKTSDSISRPDTKQISIFVRNVNSERVVGGRSALLVMLRGKRR